MAKEKNDQHYLRLIRFCGEELYPIESATWQYQEGDEDGNELWLEINAGPGTQLSDDTKSLNGQPHWELTVRAEKLDLAALKSGFKAEILFGYDEKRGESLTNFYYCEHDPSDNNQLEILEKKGNRILFRISGEVEDVNYYDGSKPMNKILVEAWFEEA